MGWFAGSVAKMFATSSQINSLAAAKSAKMASYIRREQDWTLQANLAAKEIIQLDKQITSADIRIQVAEKELEKPHTADSEYQRCRAFFERQIHQPGVIPVDERAAFCCIQAKLQPGL